MCINTSVSGTIRKMRLQRGWTQDVLAELTGMPRNSIGKIERAEHDLNIVKLEAISIALEVPLSELLRQAELSQAEISMVGKAYASGIC